MLPAAKQKVLLDGATHQHRHLALKCVICSGLAECYRLEGRSPQERSAAFRHFSDFGFCLLPQLTLCPTWADKETPHIPLLLRRIETPHRCNPINSIRFIN